MRDEVVNAQDAEAEEKGDKAVDDEAEKMIAEAEDWVAEAWVPSDIKVTFLTASLFLMCSMTSSSSTSYLMCSMTTLSRTLYLMCSMTTSSSASSFPSLMSSISCKSKKPKKVHQKKNKKMGVAVVLLANVRFLGLVKVRLANEQPLC